ncbi:S-layer homology domain-containing protein [Xylanibacillus composti]|uniref:SLH domain-containing protein n=1 Tax=Xylanibacillus composti TaxID=1572762 RepID=A0A8J4H207_9BACL|nr:S-layer homology domain-containing protein [Xylanibacillus composti]MDT9724055.1 S-layer homology domain-containing protein [Xylanibacillus composti]GIQ69449.1 hypothetical protein XYCOK13_22730 [Xylanibacillus composti]
MRKIMIMLLVLSFLAVNPATVFAESAPIQLTDIAGHWAEDAIKGAVQKGYVSGYPDDTFKPNQNVTRAEFIKMLVDALKLPKSVGGSPWYQGYVSAALEFDIHSTSDFTNYGEQISRLEMMRLAARSLATQHAYSEYLAAFDNLYNGDIPFVDYRELTEKDVPYAALTVGAKVMSGYPDHSLGLKKRATRAEAVAIIENILRQLNTSPDRMQYLQELKEIAETGTNTKAVSNLIPVLNVYEDPVTIEHANYTVNIKRYYVLPIEASDTVSFYEKKFLWDRTKLEERFRTNKEYYVIAMVDLTPKKTGYHPDLFSPSLYANPSVPFSDSIIEEKYGLLYPHFWLATELKKDETREVALYGRYDSTRFDVAVRANNAIGTPSILLVKDKE